MTIWKPELEAEGPTYLEIARVIDRDVRAGVLRPGDRLPTQRKLARALRVAVGTITRAYAEAEARGVIRGEVGRGTYVRGGVEDNLLGPVSPAAVRDLAVTWPLHPLDPDLRDALRRLTFRDDLGALLRYPPHAGFPAHRAAGARWAGRHGIEVGPERVLVCSGVQHALLVALGALAKPGDVIASECFTYPGFKQLADRTRLRIAGVSSDEQGLIPEEFERVCRTRRPVALYTIPTIQNPTTSTLPTSRREQVAAIAAKYGVWILEDDVHRLLHPEPPPSFAALLPDLTLSVASLSKVVAGGLRIAYLIAPDSQVEALTRMLWATTWMAPPLNAQIAADWIEDGTAEATVLRKRIEAESRQALAARILDGVDYRSAATGYHLWIPLRERWTAPELARGARSYGVAVAPSEQFSVSRQRGRGAIRVSLTGEDDVGRVSEGLSILSALLRGVEPSPPATPF